MRRGPYISEPCPRNYESSARSRILSACAPVNPHIAPEKRRHRIQRRLILLAHGSLDPAWRQPFTELTGDLQSRLGARAIRLAFMELVPPTLLEVAHEAACDGVRSLSVLPLFLAAGAHLSKDIPIQIEEARRQFSALRIELLPPIAADRRVQALFREIVCERFAHRSAVRAGEDQ